MDTENLHFQTVLLILDLINKVIKKGLENFFGLMEIVMKDNIKKAKKKVLVILFFKMEERILVNGI